MHRAVFFSSSRASFFSLSLCVCVGREKRVSDRAIANLGDSWRRFIYGEALRERARVSALACRCFENRATTLIFADRM